MRAAQREDAPVGVERQLDVAPHPAALRRREEVLEAVLGPLHRAAEVDRGERDERVSTGSVPLEPNAAADVGHDHADRLLAAAEDVRELRARAVGALRRGPHREQAAVAATASAPRGSIGTAASRGIP